MSSGIYCWKHIKSGKRYIGQSLDVLRRMSSHRTRLRGGYHDNNHLQRAWVKYGENGFEFSVIEYCPEELLAWREEEWIEKYQATDQKCGYNLTTGGEKPKHSEETKKIIAITSTGRKHSDDACKKISEARKGIIFSEEHKAKLSEAAKARGISKETRHKMSESRIGKKFSEERVENLRKAWQKRKNIALKTIVTV
jgi:group I intron endonuclease